ncbi:hypothetical protein F4861DRAFT_549196 [Xylaria intraflava]|nr:hypothetical protein F4861DRAFT_549196 [Xylaria intraflava]
MFDVLWTDPNVELVGQRILRKEQEAKDKDKDKDKEKDKDKKKTGSDRQSVSTNSSSSSERGFALLISKSRKKGSTPLGGKTDSALPNQEEDDESRAHRTSAYGVKAALADQDESEITPKHTEGLFLPVQQPDLERTLSPSPRGKSRFSLYSFVKLSKVISDSALSKWAHHAAIETGAFDRISANHTAPETKVETYVQTLGPSSIITQTVETTVSLRTETDTDQQVIETHISSDGLKTQTPPLAQLPEDATPETCEDAESFPPPYIAPQTPPAMEQQNNRISVSPNHQSHDHLGNPEAWKPPHEWDCTPTKQATTVISEKLRASPASPESQSTVFPDLTALQRELRIMAAASSELMLANMKSSMGEAPDAAVYKELEMTKKRWMFFALHQQSGYAQLTERSNDCPESLSTPKRNKILALYETQGK